MYDIIDKTLKIGDKFNIIAKGFTIEAILIDKIEDSIYQTDYDTSKQTRDIQYIGYAQKKIFRATIKQYINTVPQVNEDDEIDDYVTIKHEDSVSIEDVTILCDVDKL